MSKPRYLIVAIYDCPIADFNNSEVYNVKNACKASKSCKDCLYGDTKEQLIKKVAQILFKEKIKHFIELFGKSSLNKKWKQIYLKEAYEQGKKIIEFLGVEK